MNKIEIYTNENCPYCKQIKEELIKENIEFNNKTTKDFGEEWQDIINLTGMMQVPVVNFNNEFFVPGRDFQNPKQLVVLNTFNGHKHNETKRTLERIKTLNYNINIAFGRMDKTLREIESKINTDEQKEK